MKSKSRTSSFIILFIYLVVLTAYLSAIPVCVADDHKGGWRQEIKHGDKWGDRALRGLRQQGHDKGNETTGQMVAWSLAAANLPVALSIIIKGLRKFAPLAPETQTSLGKFNSTQKKYLMKFHYVLNPVILLVAVLHWTLSRCKSTSLPEWGLLIMGAIVVLGIILKFKLCPKTLLRNVYRLHAQPVPLLLIISMLVIGHLSMDP